MLWSILGAEQARQTDDELRRAIATADAEQARRFASQLRRPLERVELMALADLYYGARFWREAGALFSEVRRRFPDAPPRMSLRLAEIAIRHETRPTAALELLASIPLDTLTPADVHVHARLVEEAQRAATESPLEFADDAL